MAHFYNAQTSEPISTMYIASSGKGSLVLKAPSSSTLSMRQPSVTVQNGPGKAQATPALNPKPGEYWWDFTGLTAGSSIVAIDGHNKVLAKIPVARVSDLPSFQSINRRFNRRGMKIDLDSHIDYVCYASKIVGEGIAFRPKSATNFEMAIKDTQLFHHDDRSDHFGKIAALATTGEGYREVSTPSLHVAISSAIASVHIDSYAFMMVGPDGSYVITPDVGQHIFDELLFRLPMHWLRRRNLPFLASVLQSLHPILPNSTNRYSPIVGLKIAIGKSPNRDLRTGVPRFTFETTYHLGSKTDRRLQHTANLRLLNGGNPNRSPDWVLSLKAGYSCRDILCKDHQESVGLYLTSKKF